MNKHKCNRFKTVAKNLIIRCTVCGTFYAIKKDGTLEAMRPIQNG